MDPYAAWVHLPPSDLSDLDPGQERPRDDELDYYQDMGYAALVGPGVKT